MVEGIKFYSLIRSCKADDFCLLIRLPDEIQKKSPGIVIQFRIKFFSLFCEVTLRKYYVIKAALSVI